MGESVSALPQSPVLRVIPGGARQGSPGNAMVRHAGRSFTDRSVGNA
ncbi:hypothetical protein RR42_m4124 [Cupriavidus basilensis]|uniref:Uncharacterized protein n=1 Tax=Cupriavidus basilensis TaxID=68895 RepID=A0A0C4Y7R1_9BURK|nr:hypothetical protein RR42_m4124 [Cupriavidus basilensis]